MQKNENSSDTDILVIDLHGSVSCSKLFARKAWECLFRAVNAGTEFLSFDNFLIDYTAFAEMFEKCMYYSGPASFYWEYEPKGHYTRIYNDDYPEFGIMEPFYKITLDLEKDQIRLEKKENPLGD